MKMCPRVKIERTELMFSFASRRFITIKFRPAACFLSARETKALSFFFSPLYTRSALFLLVISIKPGV